VYIRVALQWLINHPAHYKRRVVRGGGGGGGDGSRSGGALSRVARTISAAT